MAEVKTAQTTIEEHWPDHGAHKSGTRAARWSTAEGIVCACGDVLGWPDPEHPETLAQYTKRVAQEQVDDSLARGGTVRGAFGTYGGQKADPLPASQQTTLDPDRPVEQEPPRSDDDPGPEEPEDDPWPDTPDDEPDPVVVELTTAPEELAARDAADEAQAAPWSDAEETHRRDEGLPPWEGVDDAPEPDYDSPPWASAANLTPEEAAAASAEGRAAARELIDNPEVGRALVPYAGTPIMPTDAQELDPLTGRLPPLDPTLPYTPADVELKIVEILRQLENSELFLRQQLARLHQAQHNYNMRYNLAYKTSDGRSDGQRKADAVLATERESYEMTEAEMLVRALRDSQHNLRAQLSGFQSVARSLAVSMVNALDGREKLGRPSDRLPPEPSHWDR